MWNLWPAESPTWTLNSYEELMKAESKESSDKITLQQIVSNSDVFPVEFPIDSIRCKNLAGRIAQVTLEENINSAYPVVHEQTLLLYSKFLEHKRKFGNEVEREIYKDMTLDMLVDRLLTRRAVAFVGRYDSYMLMDGLKRSGNWELIGTPHEADPVTLKNCLSYDEIKLSALLSVSSYTQFINVGDRDNCGVTEYDKNKIEERGIIVGLIGARFEKPGAMEYQEVVVTQDQNLPENGYGNTLVATTKSIFLNFYGEASATYEQLKHQFDDKTKFTPIRTDQYFNNMVYERRLALSIDTFLIEANERARSVGTMAYLHVVGIGLGVWRVSKHQNKVFMDTCAKRIELLSTTLDYIDAVCFSYMRELACGKYQNGDVVPIEHHHNNGITIHIFDRNPHEKLKAPYEGHLLVVSYAWDGNALPGNEFWWGQLTASGDPAAASSTQIAEIHNPHINPTVSGANLKVATPNGLLTLKEYQRFFDQHRVRRQHKEVSA
ncbi:hypothetical protein NQ315_009509 [Exocentrus adspersus]|uniref:Uncharacterized protein n=1 Tax=Exocentrus adspersus TaxID=1586481 RepID=A0AAV8WGK5_9CUCU|nr:hypothetical protein NQ315_009509 [Exocentrus adspersus]